jgi:hypothetical protein
VYERDEKEDLVPKLERHKSLQKTSFFDQETVIRRHLSVDRRDSKLSNKLRRRL